ncbi:hypothetical protein [Streptomyces sp. JNUCC 63]
MAVNTYRVTARRAGEWWALEVPDLPGVFTQVKRMEQADKVVREAIAGMLDTEPDSFSVDVEPGLPDEAREALEAARQAPEATRKAAERERQAMQHTAAVLTRDLSQRDAGRFLGVSFQRVSQLLKGHVPSADAGTSQQRSSEKPGKGTDRTKAKGSAKAAT